MSREDQLRALQRLLREPDFTGRARERLDATLAGYRLTADERQAIRERDWAQLAAEVRTILDQEAASRPAKGKRPPAKAAAASEAGVTSDE